MISKNSAPESWTSVKEIAVHLGVTKDTVYKWLERKKMPGHKVGKLWKFKVSEIDRWVTSGKSRARQYSKKMSS